MKAGSVPLDPKTLFFSHILQKQLRPFVRFWGGIGGMGFPSEATMLSGEVDPDRRSQLLLCPQSEKIQFGFKI